MLLGIHEQHWPLRETLAGIERTEPEMRGLRRERTEMEWRMERKVGREELSMSVSTGRRPAEKGVGYRRERGAVE